MQSRPKPSYESVIVPMLQAHFKQQILKQLFHSVLHKGSYESVLLPHDFHGHFFWSTQNRPKLVEIQEVF